jgi:hypothetical protein
MYLCPPALCTQYAYQPHMRDICSGHITYLGATATLSPVVFPPSPLSRPHCRSCRPSRCQDTLSEGGPSTPDACVCCNRLQNFLPSPRRYNRVAAHNGIHCDRRAAREGLSTRPPSQVSACNEAASSVRARIWHNALPLTDPTVKITATQSQSSSAKTLLSAHSRSKKASSSTIRHTFGLR